MLVELCVPKVCREPLVNGCVQDMKSCGGNVHTDAYPSLVHTSNKVWIEITFGDLPQPHAEEPHRPLPRPQLYHRLAPACVSRRPRWQRAKGGQRDSAWHKSCAEGRVGGREIKISQNCSRWTDGVVNYCPPRKTGADRSSHKQQSLDRNHLRYPSPWSPHRPTVSQPPPPPAVNTHRRYPAVPGEAQLDCAKGPGCHCRRDPRVGGRTTVVFICGTLGPSRPRGRLTPATPKNLGSQPLPHRTPPQTKRRRPHRSLHSTRHNGSPQQAMTMVLSSLTQSAPTRVRHGHSQTTPMDSGPGACALTTAHRSCANRSARNVDEHATASSRLGGSAGCSSEETQCTPTTNPHCVSLITVDRKSLFCLCNHVRARNDTIWAPATCESVTKTRNRQPLRLASLTAQHSPQSSALCWVCLQGGITTDRTSCLPGRNMPARYRNTSRAASTNMVANAWRPSATGRCNAHCRDHRTELGGCHGSIAKTIAVAKPCSTLSGTGCPTAPHLCQQ